MSELVSGDGELLQKQLKYCKEMLNRIKRSTYAAPFKEPVDPVKLGCLDYFEKIKTPMDLSTIKNKLDTGVYVSPLQFKEDFDLMVQNCYAYNPEGNYVRKCGKEVEKLFENLYASVPAEGAKKRRIEKKNLEGCSRILAEILKPKNRKIAWPFLEPVDKNLVPDYYDIIKSPMDISTIKKKLSDSRYESKADFYADLDLMLENCFSYNGEGSDVYKCGMELKNLIKTAGECEEGLREQISGLKAKISALEKELEFLQSKLDNTKSYSVNDRIEIAKRVEGLPESSIHHIIKIIQKYKKDLDLTQAEVEIDLKHLSNKAIEEIEMHLNNSSNKENLTDDSLSTN